MSILVRCCAVSCFLFFAWGMGWHFRRRPDAAHAGPPRAMLATALVAALCAALQIAALLIRLLRFPAAALSMYGCSAALFWWAVKVTRGQLAACGQGCVSSRIVRGGPYRYIRHPFYAAYNLTWLGGFVATGWWPLALTAVLMAAIYERFAREEERGLMAGPQGAAYREYRLRTGKYWPRIRAGRSIPD
jgi:protein-S-isoprenylcysteine O-methyltransferase Ste14